MAESIAERAKKSFNDLHTAYGSNLNYVLHFFSNGFISTVYEWLKQQDRTPEEIAEVLLHLITQLRI